MPSHYPFDMDPKEYTAYDRRCLRAPTWETFGNVPQFKILRGFSEDNGRLLDIGKTIDLYVDQAGLGRVIQPHRHTVWADNFPELVGEIKKRNLYLFDIWSYKPGCEHNGTLSNWAAPDGMVSYLEKELGDRFLGFSNSEQDGRYVGGYASQQCPCVPDRIHQYLNFRRHFERLWNQLGNRITSLVSLCFGHYFLKEENHVLLGAETAQGLPNCQVYYAFVRGAGKQYGVHWYAVASVWNRWGYKVYFSDADQNAEGGTGNCRFGPRHGSSLSLLKRLLYTHYMYNCVLLGFETFWFNTCLNEGSKKTVTNSRKNNSCETPDLSPIGSMQAAAVRFVNRHGQPGTMHTPIALLLDHFSGWAMPRHYYSGKTFQVWGTLPYGPGDYLTHGVLSMLYPGYEDSGFFHDERGFLTPTPFGDMADCLLSDVPEWILRQYGVVIVSGSVSIDEEMRDKLDAYVRGGGHLVLFADVARRMRPEWRISSPCERPAGSKVRLAEGTVLTEEHAFALFDASGLKKGRVLARCRGRKAVIRLRSGQGLVTLFLSPFGINSRLLTRGPIPNRVDSPLRCPFKLLEHVQHVLTGILSEHRLFSVDEGLGYVTCRKRKGVYTLAVSNPNMFPVPFRIVSHCGRIERIREMRLDQSEKDAAGYWPQGRTDIRGGESDEKTVAAGDMRLFRVNVRERHVRLLPRTRGTAHPANRILALHETIDIKQEIVRLPTFFQHFDGVKIDWRYVNIRSLDQAGREKDWIRRRNLRVFVDFSSGCNLFPDFAFLDSPGIQHAETMNVIEELFRKMCLMGARDAVMSLHRAPHKWKEKRVRSMFRSGVSSLRKLARRHEITIHLQHHPGKWPGKASDLLSFLGVMEKKNLRFALNTAHAEASGESPKDLIVQAGKSLGCVLLSSCSSDSSGQKLDAHLPVWKSGLEMSFTKGVEVPLVLDGWYRNWDDIYRDVRLLNDQPACGLAPHT